MGLTAALTAPEGAWQEEGRETGLLGKEGRSPDLGKEFMRDAKNLYPLSTPYNALYEILR